MTFSRTNEFRVDAATIGAAFTSTDVLAAVESIKFIKPLPPAVVSTPTSHPSKRRACPVMCTAATIFTAVSTSKWSLVMIFGKKKTKEKKYP